jgi:hypothetical protein
MKTTEQHHNEFNREIYTRNTWSKLEEDKWSWVTELENKHASRVLIQQCEAQCEVYITMLQIHFLQVLDHTPFYHLRTNHCSIVLHCWSDSRKKSRAVDPETRKKINPQVEVKIEGHTVFQALMEFFGCTHVLAKTLGQSFWFVL